MVAATQVQLELTAIDGVSAVIKNVTGTVDRLKSSYESLAGTVRALAGVIGVGMFASWVEGQIEAINHLRELSIATGTTVETLSALRSVAKQSGTDLDSVATLVQKLSKNMFEFAETGKGKAAQAFERLGYTQEQVKEGMQDMNSFLPEFAQRLLATGSATEQVAMAQQLLGRGGATLLPFLHQLAETGELVAKVTTEQAEQAHQYVLMLKQLEGSTNQLKTQMALGLLPSLMQIVQVFVDLKGKQGDATGFFEAVGTAAKYVAGILASVWLVMKDMVDGMTALAAQAMAIMHGDFAGAGAIGSARNEQSARGEAEYNAMWARLTGAPAALPRRKKGTPLGGGGDDAIANDPSWSKHDEEMFESRRAAWKESAQLSADSLKTAQDLAAVNDRYNAGLDQQAEHYRQMIDPARIFQQQLEKINELYTQGKLTEDEAALASAAVNDKMAKALISTKEAAAAAMPIARDLGMTFASSAEKAITQYTNLRDVVKGLAKDIQMIIFRRTVTEPGGQLVSDAVKSGSSSLGDWFKGLGSDTPSTTGGEFAEGGTMQPNTWNMVGEQGPEMVWSGAGGTVTPNSALGGGSDHYYIDARGADSSAIARLESRLTSLDNTVERRAVGAWKREFNRRGLSTPLG